MFNMDLAKKLEATNRTKPNLFVADVVDEYVYLGWKITVRLSTQSKYYAVARHPEYPVKLVRKVKHGILLDTRGSLLTFHSVKVETTVTEIEARIEARNFELGLDKTAE